MRFGEKQVKHQYIVDKYLHPQYIVPRHVVSAQKRGLPGQGEIAEVPTFLYLSETYVARQTY